MFKIKEVILEEEKLLLIGFLHQYGLDYEYDINYSILIYDEDKLIATASLANNVMKCFLVANEYKSNNITSLMFEHLVNELHQQGINHYFVFTTPDNEKVFTSLNMKKIVTTMNTVLLEGGAHINDVLADLKKEYNISNNKKAAVIINANPMTLGHLYLIEIAAKENKEVLVFVVSEDLSSFPFEDRFEIIKEATRHLDNITVLPTLSYLVSKLTFPKYFLREDQLINDEQTLVDVLVYKEYYTKIFNIKKRYLGEEPFSFNTNKYNQVLKSYLGNHIVIVSRKEVKKNAVSASLVRKLIKTNKMDKIKEYVPEATCKYLQSEKGKKVISLIQSKKLGRH
jgi:[citrate (pro-3S)-lyase] ligase